MIPTGTFQSKMRKIAGTVTSGLDSESAQKIGDVCFNILRGYVYIYIYV